MRFDLIWFQAKILNEMKDLGPELFNIVEFNISFMADRGFCLEFEKLDISLSEYMKHHSFTLQEIRPVIYQV